jgi:hypothetical protein
MPNRDYIITMRVEVTQPDDEPLLTTWLFAAVEARQLVAVVPSPKNLLRINGKLSYAAMLLVPSCSFRAVVTWLAPEAHHLSVYAAIWSRPSTVDDIREALGACDVEAIVANLARDALIWRGNDGKWRLAPISKGGDA